MEDELTVKHTLAGCLVALGISAGPAMAQETPLAGVYACAEIAGTSERLACFDAAVAALKTDEEEGEVAVVSAEQVEAVARESFGRPGGAELAAVAPNVAAAVERSVETPDELTLRVVKIEEQRDGKIWLTMDNGQVWRQTTGGTPRYRGAGPWEAEITKGRVGGFRLKLDGGRPIRVTRED